jgi:AcrR family transcriptional regulator
MAEAARAASPPPPRRGLDAASRRQTLVDAGWDLLVAGGPKAVTIDAVLNQIGVSRPVFYRHFTDRIDLFVALYQRYADDMVRTQEPILYTEGLTIEELLARSRLAYFDMVADHGAVIRPLIEAAQGDPRMEHVRALLRERMLAMWEAAIMHRLSDEEREVLVVRADARAALSTMIDLLQAVAQDGATAWLTGRADRQMVEDMLAVLVAGLQERLLDHLGVAPSPGGPRPISAAPPAGKARRRTM